METANAERPLTSSFEHGSEPDTDIQLPLSIDCSEKSPYGQGSPPICYVELGGHKSADSSFHKHQLADEIDLCDSPPELIRGDRGCDDKEKKEAGGCFANGAGPLNSAELSGCVVKDDESNECGSLIAVSSECLLSSSVVQAENNTVTSSTPGPLVSGLPLKSTEAPRPASHGEKERVSEAGEEEEEEEDDDRPLVVDLGESFNLSSSSASPLITSIVGNQEKGPLTAPLPVASPASAQPVLLTAHEAPEASAKPPTTVASKSTTVPSSSTSSHSTTGAAPPNLTTTTTPARVQKAIRPLLTPHLNSLEGMHAAAPSVGSASLATSHFVGQSPAGTIRLQAIQSHPPPPAPPPPPPPTVAVSGPQTNGVQFMSVLSAPPAAGPFGRPPPPSSVAPSPIHLFNIGPMPSYLIPSPTPNRPLSLHWSPLEGFYIMPLHLADAAPGMLFQSIPGATAPPPPPPPPPQPPGNFQFAPHPPLFSAAAAAAAMAAAGGPSFGNPHFARPPTMSTSLPPPPPPPSSLVPGLPPMSRVATRPQTLDKDASGLTAMVPPPGSLFIPDMGSWVAAVTSQRAPPPLPTLFPPHLSQISTASFSVADPIYSSSACRLTAPPPPTPPPRSEAKLPLPPAASTAATPSTGADVALSSAGPANITTAASATTSTPSSNVYSVSARRWRPSITRKNSSTSSTLVTAASQPQTPLPPDAGDADCVDGRLQEEVEEPMDIPPASDLAQPSPPTPPKQLEPARDDLVPRLSPPSRLDSDSHKSRVSKVAATTPPPPLSPSSSPPATTSPLAPVRRKVIAHVIDGHVLYESNLPFPVRDAMAIVEATMRQTRLAGGKREDELMATDSRHKPAASLNGTAARDSSTASSSSSNTSIATLSPVIVAKQQPMGAPEGGAPPANHRKRRSSRSAVASVVASPPPLPPPPPSSSPLPPARTLSVSSVDERKRKKSVVTTAAAADGDLPSVVPTHNGHGVPSGPNSSATTTALPNPSTSSSGALKLTLHPVYHGSTASAQAASPSKPPPSTMPPRQPQPPSAAAAPSNQLPPPPPPPPPSGPVASWSPEKVAEFVRDTPSCASYAEAFRQNEIDGEALMLLTPAQFVNPPIGMKIGHALKLADRLRQAQLLRGTSRPAT
ncbi:unnamed protein product [Mesocestoides corti]|uniref:SAM domain-containing protein n=1 Tax=Mesocestoides corti TaxID=53468 RepID=A0A0R3UI27_MESCO|nr:unnamed protein product [Mesocestoides corti]